MKSLCLPALLLLPLLVSSGPAFGQAKKLPNILLLGGAVSEEQGEAVQKRLMGKAVILQPEDDTTSAAMLANLDQWLAREKPAVIHLSPAASASPEDEANYRQIIQRAQKQAETTALVFASQPGDALTTALRQQTKVTVHDLSAAPDSVAGAVADCVLRQWIVLKYSKPSPPRPGGPEAAAKYREAEKAHDAEVPEMYKKLPIGKFQLPESADAWKQQRPDVLAKVVASLGDLPPRPAKPKARLISRELRPGYTLERVALDNGEGNDISALVLIPDKRQPHAPAVLWLHSSTPDKNGLITPGEDPESIGEALVRNGYVVLAPDAPYYGDRAENVPSGPRDVYHRGVQPYANVTQDALLKLNLWLGRTLWGMFVRDDQIALDYLCTRPEVDVQRIGVTGMSMGSTRAWWLAAVDERIAATVGVACLTRYENLIHHGNLKAHGLYYFSYGLLKHFDTEGVIALMAPRPFLALTGDLDYGSPADGIRVIEEKAGHVYRTVGAGEAFRSILYPDTGHVYTAEMRREMLAWFQQWLKPAVE
ncbi:alpha/beta hydrolase family protein [Prosthecobacter sp. SYSU 5D2]|uniref:alpha/beta hydrolase family protein n=1 Tax=Prosthecobacter sp. SYSU 5D2 TaxID=3134134 RepID=UPI0031FEA1C2